MKDANTSILYFRLFYDLLLTAVIHEREYGMKQSTQMEKTVFPSILQSAEDERRAELNNDDTCPKCGSSTCTHVWELDDERGEREVYRMEDARDDNSNPPEVE